MVPELLFDRQYFVYLISHTYDVHPNGQRFLMVKAGDPADDAAAPAAKIVVVENWSQELTAPGAGRVAAATSCPASRRCDDGG